MIESAFPRERVRTSRLPRTMAVVGALFVVVFALMASTFASQGPRPRKVAFIDDNFQSMNLMSIFLNSSYSGKTIPITFFFTCEEFLVQLVPGQWAAVVVDYHITGSNYIGPQCRNAINAIDPNILIYLSTIDGVTDRQIKDWGFDGYIPKEALKKFVETMRPFAE
jgi:hypothetical protein